MRPSFFVASIVIPFLTSLQAVAATPVTKTLVVVTAHADDEVPVAPILARYAREGVEVYLIIATDGAQGGTHTAIPRGPELARVRADEARCAADAPGIHPPILLGFPDAQLGSYMEDPGRLFQLTARVHAELERLRPDAVITWGPDGGTGHPDHRLVSSVVTQLVRAGAPGVPDRLFYASIPAEGIRAMNAARSAAPFALLTPRPGQFTTRIRFSPADADALRRAMTCHKTQYSNDVAERVSEAMIAQADGELALSSWLPMAPTNDLFGNQRP